MEESAEMSYNVSAEFASLSSRDLPSTVAIGVILALIVLLTIVGNVLVLWAVFASPNLRGPTHIIIVNLAAADLLLGTLVLPFSVTLEVSGKWYFGSVFCDIWAAVDVLCCTASIMSLCVISVDRYIGVSRPLTYHCIMTQKRSIILCLAVWISSLAISIGPLLGWKERAVLTGNPDSLTCTVTTQPGYVLFSVMGSFYLPMLVILIVYWRIYKTAARQTKFLESGTKTSKSSVNEITLRVHVGGCKKTSTTQSLTHGYDRKETAAACQGKTVSSEEGLMNSDSGSCHSAMRENQLQVPAASSTGERAAAAKSPASQQACNSGLSAKLFKFRRQKKAAKTLGIVVGAFLLCWLPFFIVLPVEALCTSCWIPPPLFSFCFWLGYCNSCLNPFIYAATSREFKRAFKKILCRTRK